jgi:hypothetical protein
VTLSLGWLCCAAALQPLLSLNSAGRTGQQYLQPASCMPTLLFKSQTHMLTTKRHEAAPCAVHMAVCSTLDTAVTGPLLLFWLPLTCCCPAG